MRPKDEEASAMLIERGIPGAKVERRFESAGRACVISAPLTARRVVEGRA
ncbi:hypothetical protein K9U39_18520 [Rhodoblastus acidophilus]|uniref:Uncharacterized protein n=1 Tax=Candidatus Rhodoblastus alkanivorans TaxID=2954117 RepID=A0ABS9Z2J1_9HYPH|nr:hypothetical protein [Candidatus Rhodoblastus alkanivorans]MCI4677494.1 hypothetical protein [Candidatus Rhodoblastus alkanivorans]MCI4681853.1 hypothetical protein [Candidatus Rhodoblastus alkanivorans]MDI4642903.1 hypothetical protein [Rhodoblastus acidophilus]